MASPEGGGSNGDDSGDKGNKELDWRKLGKKLDEDSLTEEEAKQVEEALRAEVDRVEKALEGLGPEERKYVIAFAAQKEMHREADRLLEFIRARGGVWETAFVVRPSGLVDTSFSDKEDAYEDGTDNNMKSILLECTRSLVAAPQPRSLGPDEAPFGWSVASIRDAVVRVSKRSKQIKFTSEEDRNRMELRIKIELQTVPSAK